jgi:AraC-like DNA-binding protein
MAVILDTDLIDPADRAAAVGDAMARSGIPARVTHEPPLDQVHARIQLWPLGGGTTLMHRVGSGVSLTRTPRQVRAAAPERIAVTVLGPGRWLYSQGGHDQRVESSRPRMVLTDHAAPYAFTRIGGGETFSLNLDHEALGLPVDQVRAAVDRVERSPVYPLVRNQILTLSAELDAIPSGPALGMVANAATELIRALIVSATADPDLAHVAMTDSLALRIGMYIDEHLYDSRLAPATIAHFHHISLRQLYNVWSRNNAAPLAQTIMRKRLDAARRDLARPDARALTISAIAQRCGFVDSAHFARKFRQVYGCSPREWRAITRPNELDHCVLST